MMKYLLLLLISVLIKSGQTANIPCKLPYGSNGQCVALTHCSNLYALTVLAREIPQRVSNYLSQVKCALPDSSSGVCCQSEKVYQLPENCGIDSKSRIAHGNKTAVFEFPWTALLMYRDLKTNVIRGHCGGSLINDRYVITAAHCIVIDERKLKLEYVRLGEHTISTTLDCNNYTDFNGVTETECASEIENVQIETTIVHPNYNNSPFSNDIALIRLAQRIIFKDHIQPICLPMSVELRNMLSANYTVAGWGLTEQQEPADTLMKAVVPRVDISQCQSRIDEIPMRLKINVDDNQICAGGFNRVDSCTGDSGGPLMKEAIYRNKTRIVLFGVVSFGVTGCGQHTFPGVYVRVGKYLSWILANMYA